MPSNSADGAMLAPGATQIEVGSGRFVDVLHPDPATIELDDIARGLAFAGRFGGHTTRFYSVAEHSLLVHDLLRWQGAGREYALAGLLHDAAEAYLGDVVAPLKYALRGGLPRSSYDALSEIMDHAIGQRFDVDHRLFGSMHVRTADMWALRIEARELTFSGGAGWRWPGELPNGGELPDDVAWHGGAHHPNYAADRWQEMTRRLLPVPAPVVTQEGGERDGA